MAGRSWSEAELTPRLVRSRQRSSLQRVSFQAKRNTGKGTAPFLRWSVRPNTRLAFARSRLRRATEASTAITPASSLKGGAARSPSLSNLG